MASSPLRPVPLSLVIVTFSFFITLLRPINASDDPVPAAWPEQFHALLLMNSTGNLSTIDLWYDWPNGRNFNIMRDQLSSSLFYDLEWNNGTSFFYRLDPGSERCSSAQLEVGILRPNWLDGATYLGQRTVNGFLCNLWEKADFIWYYEDVDSKRPVKWVFYTGREAHVMTFELGAVLEDANWQAPSYCFTGKDAVKGQNPELAMIGNSGERPLKGALRGYGNICRSIYHRTKNAKGRACWSLQVQTEQF